jgi:SAM-dependent methyltransferase
MINYYQSIKELGIVGRFDTDKEFDKIGLPKDLRGNNVLDIGCNIGAFLVECNKRGAMSLAGVEVNKEARLKAKEVLSKFGVSSSRFILFEDIASLMQGIQGCHFDLVLLLSVTHVAEGMTGQEILDKAWELTDGLLIVEINDRLQKEKIVLPEGVVLYGKNKDDRSVYHISKNNYHN